MEYVFADLTLDPGRRELRRGPDLIDVQPQVFDLLLYLLQNRDRVVSKDDLIAAVWGGRIVSESTLTSRITAARKAVGDSGETQTLIRTVARKGIRFVGTVREQADVSETLQTSAPPLNAQALAAAPVTGADSAPRRAETHKLGWVLASALAAATAIFLFQQFVPSTGTPSAPQQGGLEAAKAASSSKAGAISIAVLPFLNLSGDAGQEFFSDGITEEITATLAKIPDLRIVARTSAFQFKGQNRDIQSIGRQLRATHLIEGSVRKAGDRVRITAQLVQADNGVHVWSSSYDRQLVSVFAMQEEIAQAIAAALRVPLGLVPGQTLVFNRNIDPESYPLFLRARRLFQRRGVAELTEAIKLLEAVVARAPDFAPAWAQLALAYQHMPFAMHFLPEDKLATRQEKRRAADEWLPKAEAAAEKAIQLDANLAEGYSSLGLTMAFRGRLVQSEKLLLKALELDPFSPEALHTYNNLLGAVGRWSESLDIKQRLLRMEPFVNAYSGAIRDLLWINGRTDNLITSLKATGSAVDLAYLARIYWWDGRHAEALDALRAIPPGSYPEGNVEDSIRLLRAALTESSAPQRLPRLGRRLEFVYVHVGAPEAALDRFEDNVAAGFSPPNLMIGLWVPSYAPVRKTERFKSLARNAGLVEYWRDKGWPKFCRPTTGDNFVCD